MELEHLRTQVRNATYAQMPEIFVAAFPAMRPAYDDLLEEWDDEMPGETIVFDDVVGHYLLDVLRASDTYDETLTLFFGMLEEMALHREQDVRNLLDVTLLEQIASAKLYTTAIRYSGPATRQMLDDVAPRFGITHEPVAQPYSLPPATIPPRAWQRYKDEDD